MILVIGSFLKPSCFLLFVDAVAKNLETKLLDRLLGNKVVTASEFANGFPGVRPEHVIQLVKERLSELVVCHQMTGELGTLFFLSSAVSEELLHRVYVSGRKAAKKAEKAIASLRRECQEAQTRASELTMEVASKK